MNNITPTTFHCGISSQVQGNDSLGDSCSCVPNVFQPCPPNFNLSNFTTNDVSGIVEESGILGLSDTCLIPQLQVQSTAAKCDTFFTNASDKTLPAPCSQHSLLDAATATFTPQSTLTVAQAHIHEGIQLNSSTPVIATDTAFRPQPEDSLFSDTMRALLQSAPLSLESNATSYYENYREENLPFNVNFNIISKEQNSSNVVSFTRQNLASQTSYATHSGENNHFDYLVNTNDHSANVLPTLRSFLESDASEVLVSTSVGQCCSPLSSHPDQLGHVEVTMDESQGTVPTAFNQTPLQHSNLPSHTSFAIDSTSFLNPDIAFIDSTHCSQNPASGPCTIVDQCLDTTHSNAEKDLCYIFDNGESGQSSVVRHCVNLQLSEPTNSCSDASETITLYSPVSEPNITQQPQFNTPEFASCSVFMHPDGLPCEQSVDGENISVTALSLGSHNSLHHLQSLSNVPVTHGTLPWSTESDDVTLLTEDRANHSPTGTTESTLLPAKPSSPAVAVGQAGGFYGHTEPVLSPSYRPRSRGLMESDEVNKARLVRTNGTFKSHSVQPTQRSHNSQLVLHKKIRTPVHHRHVSSIARDCPGLIGPTSSTGSGSIRRSTAMVHVRDRCVEPASSHPLLTNVIDPRVHTIRQNHLATARTVSAVHRTPLLLSCSIGARKRTNRSIGLVNHMLTGPFVAVTPSVRRKYTSSAPHRNAGAHCSHTALHRASTSASMLAGFSHGDSVRSAFSLSQLLDSTRPRPPSRAPGSKPFATVSVSPAFKHTFNTGAPCQIAQAFHSPPSPHQAFSDHSTLRQCRIQIVSQPEAQHRARYQTEGSRGAVKNRSGTEYPTVQLCGWNGRASLQVFVACESGRVRPHPFYQAYLVAGKSTKYCVQTILDGVNVVEIPFSNAENWTLSVECVGILKLRKSDVEHRAQVSLSTRQRCPADGHRDLQGNHQPSSTDSPTPAAPSTPKLGNRKSGKARLVFRALLFQEHNGNNRGCEVIQVASEPILCTQLIGDPEICRISLTEAPVTGGQDLFLLGKNLGKDCHIWFREMSRSLQPAVTPDLVKLEIGCSTKPSGGSTYSAQSESLTTPFVWQAEGVLESEYSHQTHLVCRIPAYNGPSFPLVDPLVVEIVISSGGRWSIPHQFTYLPVPMNSIISSGVSLCFPSNAVSESSYRVADSTSDEVGTTTDNKIAHISTDQEPCHCTVGAFSEDMRYSAYCTVAEAPPLFDIFQISPPSVQSAVSYTTHAIHPTVAYHTNSLPLLTSAISGVDVLPTAAVPIEQCCQVNWGTSFSGDCTPDSA